MDLKKKIIKYAKDSEIDLIAFTKSEKFLELQDIILKRKSKNYLSGFEEKDMQKQIDPMLTLEDAKSIIVIGISYNHSIEKEDNPTSSNKHQGKISKSSWGRDYHFVLKEKMTKLIEYINKDIEDFKYKYFVDTGPLVDRYLAYKAGIGWYGKNNCIISKEYGSWIFIGYILCNIEIEPDPPHENTCLDCKKCIDLCPTGALMDNYEYNAKKCISYLTVTKEDIDYDLRKKMKDSIYGCDICQRGCPHNQNLVETKNKGFEIDKYSQDVDLLDILDMSKKDFKIKFGHAALAWRGHNVIKRNAIIALGNSKNPNIIKNLTKYLKHDSSMIRKYIVWAIINLDKNKGEKILEKHLEVENDIDVINEIKKLIDKNNH